MAESLPQFFPLQPEPKRVQVTPLFCESFCTVAVKFCDFFTRTLAFTGRMLTLKGPAPGMTVIVADADLVWSDTDTAVRVTLEGLGAEAGAV
jgi:hypothetical protein